MNSQTKTQNKLLIKLFAGCFLSSELKMHLHQSTAWKQASILPISERHDLKEIRYQGKDYLGWYLNDKQVSIVDLKKIEISLKDSLHNYCPDYSTDNLKLCIFGQVFIA